MTEPKAPMGVEEAINYAVSLIANVAELVPSAPEEQEKAARHIATLKAHLAALAQPKEEGVVHTAVADGHGLAPDVAARFSDEVVERMARAHYIAYAPSDDARQARENFWDNVLDHKRPWVEIMRAALAASPAPPAGDGWEPIETAPKDGSRILVFDEMAADNESPVVMVAWLNDAERHNRKRFAWCVPGSWQDEQGGHCTADRPTHWRPLPAPPQGAGEKGGG
jgi:hypothetical protein